MSTLRVNNLQNTSTTDGGISIDSSGHVTVDNVAYPSTGPLSSRRLNINGAMQVAQRGTSSTGVGATNNVFPAIDRIKFLTATTAGRMTVSQDSDAPDGFANSMKLDVTTADTSIAADELFGFRYQFEGQDLQMLKKGTASAEQLTISFWVKGNAAATYTLELHDEDNARSNTQNFSVTTSWNRVELTFAGDTTGAFDDDNGDSLRVNFWLHAGSNFTGGTFTSNTWASRTNANTVNSTDTSIFDSTDRTLFITGLQMEVGSVATPFEHRSYGDELAKCERYFQSFNLWVAAGGYPYTWAVTKRSAPSVTSPGTTGFTTSGTTPTINGSWMNQTTGGVITVLVDSEL